MRIIKVFCQIDERRPERKEIIRNALAEFNSQFADDSRLQFKIDFLDARGYLAGDFLADYSFCIIIAGFESDSDFYHYISNSIDRITSISEFSKVGRLHGVSIMHSGRKVEVSQKLEYVFRAYSNFLTRARSEFPDSLVSYEIDAELGPNIRSDLHRWRNIVLGRLAPPPISVLPAQQPHGYMFAAKPKTPFYLADDVEPGLRLDPDQQQSYDDIKSKAELLISECESSSNRLAELRLCCTKMLQAMGVDLASLKVRAFWAQMNSLRHRVEADNRLIQLADRDDPPLPESVSALLRDVVDTSNVFVAYEPKLRSLDEVARDPSHPLLTPRTLNAAQSASNMASYDRRITTVETGSVLQQMISEARPSSNDFGSPAKERAAQFSVLSSRNLVLEAIRRVYKSLLEEGDIAGESNGRKSRAERLDDHTTAMARYLVDSRHQIQALIETLGNNQALQKIFAIILKEFM